MDTLIIVKIEPYQLENYPYRQGATLKFWRCLSQIYFKQKIPEKTLTWKKLDEFCHKLPKVSHGM